MNRVSSHILIGLIVFGLVFPLASIVSGSRAAVEDKDSIGPNDFEEELSIETDPAVPPTGDMQPEEDENVDVKLETYTTGMDEAYLNVSAVKWDGEPVKGLEPSSPGSWKFDILGNGYQAESLLNNIKYFRPGTRVTWRVYVINYTEQLTYASQNYSYEVKGAWHYNNSYDDAFKRNIEMDISPNLPPNAYDETKITLRSKYDDVEIGQAILDMKYENATRAGEGSLPFRTVNPVKGIEQVTIPGYPADTNVEFQVRAWDDPDDSSREIKSDVYNYTVSAGNTFQSNEFEDNIEIRTNPDSVSDRDTESVLNIGEPVNITIESRDPDVPIRQAVLKYTVDGRGINPQDGQDVFNKISTTKWYYKIDGQPPGIEIDFQVQAYDIMKSDIISSSYSYSVARKPMETPDEMTFFYITVFDGEKKEYVGGAEITIENESWIWEGETNRRGFAYPTEMNSFQPKYLHYGTYNITVEYEGAKKNIKYELSPGSDETVRIDFNPSDKRREGVYADPIEMPPYYLIGLTVTASLAGAVGFSLYYLRKGQDESEGLAVGG